MLKKITSIILIKQCQIFFPNYQLSTRMKFTDNINHSVLMYTFFVEFLLEASIKSHLQIKIIKNS